MSTPTFRLLNPDTCFLFIFLCRGKIIEGCQQNMNSFERKQMLGLFLVASLRFKFYLKEFWYFLDFYLFEHNVF